MGYRDIKTKNFTLQEFANTLDGGALKLDLSLIYKMQELRELIGTGITVTSGYRTPAFNKKVGGSKNSSHTKGKACDCRFDFSKYNTKSLTKIAKDLGFNRIGFYWESGKIDGKLDRIHLDIDTQEFEVLHWDKNGRFVKRGETDTQAKPVEPVKPVEPTKPDSRLSKNCMHLYGKHYNKPIPQLVYKGIISHNKGRVFKSTAVKYLQRALQSLGYYRSGKVDGWMGNNTSSEVVKLKLELGLPVDISLNESDIYKINKALVNNFEKYESTKYGYDSWQIPVNSKYTYVLVHVNPERLDIAVGDKSGSRYTEDNVITSSYQWYQSSIRKMWKYGITVKNSSVIQDGQVHSKPCMTLYSKRGKHFDVKTVLTANELGAVRFADAGLELYPDRDAHLKCGFTGRYADVVRRTGRPFNIKLDGELFFGVHPSMGKQEAFNMGKYMVLGWVNTWDAGGSTLLKVNGKWLYKTTRRLYQLIKF